MRRKIYLLWLLCVGGISGIFIACNHPVSIEDQVPDVVSYNFNIRPILSDKCYKCHGPDASKRQAGLRLDIPESAYSALKDNPAAHALVPFDLDKSELFQRVSTSDSAL